MTNREACAELVQLLREACALAAERDPTYAAAIMRSGMRALLEVEAREAAAAKQARETEREARASLRALERAADALPNVDVEGEQERSAERRLFASALAEQVAS